MVHNRFLRNGCYYQFYYGFGAVSGFNWASQVAQWKESTCDAGDMEGMGSIPALGKSRGGGHGNLLQDPSLENPMDRGAWWALVHRLAKGWTWLK